MYETGRREIRQKPVIWCNHYFRVYACIVDGHGLWTDVNRQQLLSATSYIMMIPVACGYTMYIFPWMNTHYTGAHQIIIGTSRATLFLDWSHVIHVLVSPYILLRLRPRDLLLYAFLGIYIVGTLGTLGWLLWNSWHSLVTSRRSSHIDSSKGCPCHLTRYFNSYPHLLELKIFYTSWICFLDLIQWVLMKSLIINIGFQFGFIDD